MIRHGEVEQGVAGVHARIHALVHLAVDDTYFETPSDAEIKSVMETYDLEPGYILYLGALDKRKNVIILVQAYSEMRNKEKNLPKLVLAGDHLDGVTTLNLCHQFKSLPEPTTRFW